MRTHMFKKIVGNSTNLTNIISKLNIYNPTYVLKNTMNSRSENVPPNVFTFMVIHIKRKSTKGAIS